MPISVTVKTLDSQNHQIDGVDDEISVSGFKEKIATTVGVAADCQRLIHCGRVLRDDKKLKEYGVNGKVIHLVQRNPNIPADGPDPVTASEARARGASPSQGRTHHHIHIQQQPGYIPSMTFRLNVARELLSRANRTIGLLENPNAPPQASPPPEAASNGASANVTASVSGASSDDMGPIPSQVAQAIQSVVNNAVQSMTSGSGRFLQPGHFEMSVSIDQNGQIISQSSPQRQQQQSAQNGTGATPATTGSSAASSANQTPTRDANASRQLQHPPLSELADAMDELNRTEDRFRPFRQQMYELLRNDPTFESDSARQESQQLFNRATEIMHLLSHVQHALSDAVVNFAQNTPRHIRASPLVIQSRSTYFQSLSSALGGAHRASASRGPAAATTSTTSTNTTASSSAPTPASVPLMSGPRPMEVEVNVEPIIVGIEMDPGGAGGIAHVANRGGSTSNGRSTERLQFLQNLAMQLMPGAAMPAHGASTANVASTAASSTSNTQGAASSAPGQDSQARGGAQTQPTTSTNTRSSAHVHYAPRGSLGFNLSPMMMGQPTFDPLLPCNSHHTANGALNRRTRHPAGPLMPQRPRSASVPPRGNAANSNTQSATTANRPTEATQAHSARTSPERASRNRPFSDFEVSTHIDVVPMIMTPQGVMAFGSPRTTRPRMGPQSGTNNSTSMETDSGIEPSLATLLGASGPGDANVVMGILNELRGALSNQGNGERRTVSAYLESLPDYTYVEGESLVTDLLMLIARNTTFSDLVNILMGSSDSINGLQDPLRQFLRRYVLVPPNDDEQHDIDAAILYLVDVSFPHLEEMAREANVRSDIDFAETLHSFMAANLSSFAETILRASTPEAFGAQFRERGNAFLTRLTILCLRCFVDGNASLERVLRGRLEAISGDVGSVVREWILSASVGHLRNFVAGVTANGSSSEDIEQYFVRPGPDSEQRKAARQRRLQQHQTREEETFVTPRSSPVSMEVEEPSAQPTVPEAPIEAPIEVANVQVFPSSLMSPRTIDSTISIGSQGWHGTMPSNWVPIVARDINRQSSQDQRQQRPFSDAYISTQSAKRRRIASRSKPEGNAEQFIADTLTTAIRSSGVTPVNPVEDVIRETSQQASVQESLRHNFRTNVSRRINNDPDYEPKKFPFSKDFSKD